MVYRGMGYPIWKKIVLVSDHQYIYLSSANSFNMDRLKILYMGRVRNFMEKKHLPLSILVKMHYVLRPCQIMIVCKLFQKVKEGCFDLLIWDFDSHYD